MQNWTFEIASPWGASFPDHCHASSRISMHGSTSYFQLSTFLINLFIDRNSIGIKLTRKEELPCGSSRRIWDRVCRTKDLLYSDTIHRSSVFLRKPEATMVTWLHNFPCLVKRSSSGGTRRNWKSRLGMRTRATAIFRLLYQKVRRPTKQAMFQGIHLFFFGVDFLRMKKKSMVVEMTDTLDLQTDLYDLNDTKFTNICVSLNLSKLVASSEFLMKWLTCRVYVC